MAIYKLFPEKDATIYSSYPEKNTGLDEILEVSLFGETLITSGSSVSRALIKFSTDEITNIINNIPVSSSGYDVFLKAYLADASELPLNFTLQCLPISGSWIMGTGRLSNSPETQDGVSWNFTDADSVISWPTGSGGSWYQNLLSTQSFDYNSVKDIEFKVTDIIKAVITGSINNEGFLIKHDDSLEFNYPNLGALELKYFSKDTHTIYPPCLEIRWDDFVYHTGSLEVITTDRIIATVKNNKGEYQQDSITRFRLGVRDRNPVRRFQTSSVYLNNKALPTTAYWAIKDVISDEWVIDFDENYTKISTDETSSYFDVYMNGLQPERYYKLLIKVVIDGSVIIFDNDYTFKVVR
jgi:hypothetical protein